MIINSQPKSFSPITVTFDNEAELHDVVAALAAYGQKLTSVSGTGISKQYNLNAYSGNARKTSNKVLAQFAAAI